MVKSKRVPTRGAPNAQPRWRGEGALHAASLPPTCRLLDSSKTSEDSLLMMEEGSASGHCQGSNHKSVQALLQFRGILPLHPGQSEAGRLSRTSPWALQGKDRMGTRGFRAQHAQGEGTLRRVLKEGAGGKPTRPRFSLLSVFISPLFSRGIKRAAKSPFLDSPSFLFPEDSQAWAQGSPTRNSVCPGLL
jgi:hypothetical protein